MKSTRYDEFLKAYKDYPSQDNEGFVPDRGGFKCGFMSAWDIQQKEIDRLRAELNYCSEHGSDCPYYEEHDNWKKACLQESRDVSTARIQNSLLKALLARCQSPVFEAHYDDLHAEILEALG